MSDSKYAPHNALPGWKRPDIAREAIHPQDHARIDAAAGVIDPA